MNSFLRRSLTTLGIGTAAAAMAVLPTAANAQEVPGLNVDYDASGSTYVASTDTTLPIAPTTLSVTVDPFTSELTGHMPLQSTQSNFTVIGFIPVSAQVHFEEAAPVTGALLLDTTTWVTTVESEASYYIRLSNLKVAGIPTLAGNNCRTKDPVVIPANTPAGGSFDLEQGGELTGEFSIGNFKSCGLIGAQTHLINALIPGGGNTADLTVSNGRLS